MDYRFRLVAFFVILDASFIWTIDGTDLGTNTRIGSFNQSRAHLARQLAPTYNNTFITPDFVFPTAFEIAVLSALPVLSSIQTGPSKTKSELKCDEYAKEVVNNTGITCLVGPSNANKSDDNDIFHIVVVVNGAEARTDEFPHMVALGKRNSNKMFTLMCGATLISHTWVLSAAHCTHGPNGIPSHARIGFHRLTDDAGVTIGIKQMIRHPDYKPPVMYADIALVKLRRAITFTASIRPACLHQEYDVMPTNATISGWGVTEYAGEESDRLQKADLTLVDNLACTRVHNSSKEVPYGIISNMICAGDPLGGWTKDTCQGDSGGPLQVTHSKNTCLFQVIGITSFGQGCAIINTPGVYTRVSSYVPWIESIVWPREK